MVASKMKKNFTLDNTHFLQLAKILKKFSRQKKKGAEISVPFFIGQKASLISHILTGRVINLQCTCFS